MVKKLKKIGFGLLIAGAVAFYGFPLITFFVGKAFDVPLNQPVQNIRSIELLDTSKDQPEVLLILEGSEMDRFLEDFLSLRAGRYVNDPPTHYGILTVKVCYQDGAADYTGSDLNEYYLVTGEEDAAGWYYMGRDEMIRLFQRYVDWEKLPDRDLRLN